MKHRQINKGLAPQLRPSVRSFTLLELIIVIVIIGILATLGYTQYSKTVESTRLAEAKVIIGSMRKLATEYYMKNGTLNGISDSDVIPSSMTVCNSTGFYAYQIPADLDPASVSLAAVRCTVGGKPPDWQGIPYTFYLVYTPSTGAAEWHCGYFTGDPYFGYPS